MTVIYDLVAAGHCLWTVPSHSRVRYFCQCISSAFVRLLANHAVQGMALGVVSRPVCACNVQLCCTYFAVFKGRKCSAAHHASLCIIEAQCLLLPFPLGLCLTGGGTA